MIITARMLRGKGATCSQIANFEREWPDGGEVTEANLLRAAAYHLDLVWFGQNYLPLPLREEFEGQAELYVAEFDKQVALLLEGGTEKRRLLLEGEFEREWRPLWMTLNRKVALLLWSIWQRKVE